GFRAGVFTSPQPAMQEKVAAIAIAYCQGMVVSFPFLTALRFMEHCLWRSDGRMPCHICGADKYRVLYIRAAGGWTFTIEKSGGTGNAICFHIGGHSGHIFCKYSRYDASNAQISNHGWR
ncbi:MAG: hypothetical protein ABJ237_03430, partial [Parasphingorhabdus sp.]|uniref:hypothetical protein n=1 Tax=Parasphingorhabdus sp. TaxID=2709688 RepID=UPI003297C3B5